jgi:hypothetical protein
VALRRTLSTPPEDSDAWEAAEAVAATLDMPLSRLVAQALREHAPVRVWMASRENVPAAAR